MTPSRLIALSRPCLAVAPLRSAEVALSTVVSDTPLAFTLVTMGTGVPSTVIVRPPTRRLNSASVSRMES